MSKTRGLSASLEDYLEAIYHIVGQKRAARAKDIVQRMGVHNSSVTQALRALSERGLINYAPYDIITLTAAGHKVANNVVRRHQTLMDFLVKILALDEGTAEDVACKMEHAISADIQQRLADFLVFMESCPLTEVEWREPWGFMCMRCEAETAAGDCEVETCRFRDAVLAGREDSRGHSPDS